MDRADGKVDLIRSLVLPIAMGTLMFIPLLVCNYTGNTTWDGVYVISVFSAYFGFVVMISVLKEYWIFRRLHAVLFIPVILLLSLRKPVFLFGGILTAYIGFSILIPGATLLLIHKGIGFELNDAAFLYLFLTFTAIIATTFGDKLLLLHHWMNNRDHDKELINLSYKIINERKISWALYLIYFCLLIVFNINELNDQKLSSGLDLSNATLQSFATFLAYDQVRSNWNRIIKE